MRAIILAAGCGSRLREVTEDPKCLLRVGGESIIARQVRLLKEVHAGITVVVGYQADKVKAAVGPSVDYVHNPLWACSNTLVSLLFPISGPPRDALVLNGDVVFPNEALPSLLACDYSAVAVQGIDGEDTGEQVQVRLGDRWIRGIGKGVNTLPGGIPQEAIGINLLRAPLVRDLRDCANWAQEPWKAFYEEVLHRLVGLHPIEAVPISQAIEIDTPEDYQRAREMYG